LPEFAQLQALSRGSAPAYVALHLADASERRDVALFETLDKRLTELALEENYNHEIGMGLKEPLYALDSTTIDMCRSLVPWADFRSTKAAKKSIPSLICAD